VRGLTVEAVVERTVFTVLRYLLCVGWGCTWLWIVLGLWSFRPLHVAKLLTVSSASLLIVAGLIPQPHLNDGMKAVWFGAQDLWYTVLPETTTVAVAPSPDSSGSTSAQESPPPVSDGSSSDTSGVSRPSGQDVASETAGEASPATPDLRRLTPAKRAYWKPDVDDLDKWEHLTTFLLLAMLASFAYRRHSALKTIAALILFAVCVQVLQSLSITRDADGADLGFDLLGLAIGCLVVVACRGLARWLPGRWRVS